MCLWLLFLFCRFSFDSCRLHCLGPNPPFHVSASIQALKKSNSVPSFYHIFLTRPNPDLLLISAIAFVPNIDSEKCIPCFNKYSPLTNKYSRIYLIKIKCQLITTPVIPYRFLSRYISKKMFQTEVVELHIYEGTYFFIGN